MFETVARLVRLAKLTDGARLPPGTSNARGNLQSLIRHVFCGAMLLVGIGVSRAWADGRQIEISANDGVFTPSVVEIAVGEKIELVVKNDGHEAEEFESIDLKREKVVPPGKSITVKIGPLKAGSYTFFGDFHPQTARGRVDVK